MCTAVVIDICFGASTRETMTPPSEHHIRQRRYGINVAFQDFLSADVRIGLDSETLSKIHDNPT